MVKCKAGLGIGAFVLTCSAATAHAKYTGLTVELHTSVSIAGNPYDVWRIYANFSDPGDRLVAGFGGSPPLYGPMQIQSRNAADTGFGNPFFNVGNQITAPTQAGINANPALQWDTFVTIGVPIADMAPGGDQVELSPGFVGISGNNFSHGNQIWFVQPTINGAPPLQSVAGWAGDGDPALRVLMMQLTVSAGDNVRGVINLDWFPPMGQGGGNVVVHESFQSFNSFTVPAPSTLAACLLAMIGRSRRR